MIRRGPRGGGPRGAGPEPPAGYGDDAVLSEAEVQRRINVEGGGQLQAPPPEHKFRDRRPTAPVAPRETGSAVRDSLLLIGLVIAGLVAVGVLLPEGPLAASATSAPSAQATTAAVLQSASSSAVPRPTGGLITLPPGPSAPPTETPATPPPATARPGASLGPAAPTPSATPQPTPRVTPRPTRTPGAATPTAPPQTATLTVRVSVVNDDGGTSSASAWTVTVQSGGTASPASFAGSAGATVVTLTANASYSVSASGPAGYAAAQTINCGSASGGLPAPGSSRTCTIIRNDIAPRVTVTTIVDGGPAAPGEWTVSVSATGANPASFAGSAAGVLVRLDAGAEYEITTESPSGPDYSVEGTAGCAGSGLALGASATCTFTYTYEPPPTDTPAPATILVPFTLPLGAPLRGRRRWATTPS